METYSVDLNQFEQFKNYKSIDISEFDKYKLKRVCTKVYMN